MSTSFFFLCVREARVVVGMRPSFWNEIMCKFIVFFFKKKNGASHFKCLFFLSSVVDFFLPFIVFIFKNDSPYLSFV